MKVKEQLAIYTRALEAEEQFRAEVNAKIDARITTIRGLIDGVKKLLTLGEASDLEIPIDEEYAEPEAETIKVSGSKQKTGKSAKKTVAKKDVPKKDVPKKVKAFSKASSVPKSKKGSEVQRPRLEDSIQIVMGNKELSAPDIHAELKSRHWIPDSKDPLGYIRYALSANPAIFLRREGVRGKYHLGSNNPYATGKHKGPIEGHINPKSKKKGAEELSESESKEIAKVNPPPTPTPVHLAQDGHQEDPAAVVAELLQDGGIRAFGRQAPPLSEPSSG
jgi:hypothetical protein